MYYLLPMILMAVVTLPLIAAYRDVATGHKTGRAKKALMLNLAGFAFACLVCVVLPLGGFASAATVGAATGIGAGLGYIGAGLSTGLACVGAGVAVGQASSAAIGAISEDPKNFGRAMIFVVLGEGIAIYGLVISIMIISKIQ